MPRGAVRVGPVIRKHTAEGEGGRGSWGKSDGWRCQEKTEAPSRWRGNFHERKAFSN